MKKTEMILRVADDIIENVYNDSGYRELAYDFVKDGLKKWNKEELKRYLGEE
jgi:hypothetical protein